MAHTHRTGHICPACSTVSESRDDLRLVQVGPDGLQVLLDATAYDLRSVQKAAYYFGDRCHILIRTPSTDTIEVALKAKNTLENAEFLAGEFCNAVLDQELRRIILEETKGIRDLLLAQAFSKTNLIAPDLDTLDPT